MGTLSAIIAGVRAWGFWPVLWDCAAKLSRWLIADLWRCTTLACLLVAGVQTARLDGLHIKPGIGPLSITLVDITGWRPRAEKAEARVSELLSASRTAAALAEAQRLSIENQSAINARKADHEPPQNIATHRADADRYADARRLRQVDCDLARPTAATGPTGIAQDCDGPSPDAVVIPRADFDQLRDNTLRLERVRQWAEEEVEAGRAIEVDD
jgi:hypothetical protein